MTGRRPPGIAIIAVALLLLSPLLIVSGVKAIINVLDLLKVPGQDGGALLVAISICPLVLGIACASSGLDLWRLKKKGRAPAIFLLVMATVFAAVWALIFLVDRTDSNRAGFAASAAVSLVCVWAIVYLCLPQTRRSLQSNAKP